MRQPWSGGVLLLVAAGAWGQEEKKPDEEIVISASPLKPHDVFDTPYSAGVVTGDDIQGRRLSRTVPDALKEEPGVSVQKTSNGHGSPFIRGFTGFRNVFLIDGIRLNNSVFREGPNQYWNTVDEFLIDRLEIVRGPSSILYGSDSIGGTVVAYTKEPAIEPGLHLHPRGFYRFASAEQSHSGRAEFWGNTDGLGWFVGATYRNFGDVTGGEDIGVQPYTKYDEYDGDLKLLYKLGEKSKLVLAYQHAHQDEVPRTHRTFYAKSWEGTSVGKDARADFDQGRQLLYLQYHTEFEGGFIDALKASVSWHRMDEEFVRETTETSPTKSRLEMRELDVNTPAIWLQAGKSTGVGYFTGGFEFYHDRVNSSGYDVLVNGTLQSWTRGEIADDASYDLLGIYLQDELTLGKFDLTGGIRYSYASVDAGVVDPNPAGSTIVDSLSDHYQAVTGSLRGIFHATENWNVIAGWGMGFRAPTLDDSTAVKLVMSGSLDLPSEGLDPEKSHTFDLGVRARYPKWEAEAFVFYTLLQDLIRRVPSGSNNTKANFADGWVYGFELAGLYRLTEEISFRADFAYVRGMADALVGGVTELRPLDKVNPATLHIGARYQPKDSKVWVEGLVTLVARQDNLSPSDQSDTQRIPPGGTPGYVSLALRGGWRIQENFAVTAAAENIGNADYRIHGSGQNEPGTNFILGADVRF